MGIYTLSLITGGHIAPIAGGYIVKNTLTWNWCFYIPAIITAFMLPLFIFTVPETLYSHSAERVQRPYGSWIENMSMLRSRAHSSRSLKFIDFVRPIQMLMYPSVLLPMLYYAVSFGFGSILFIITSANIFLKVYKYKPYQTGVLLGVPLTVGSIIGELVAGGLSDWISEKRALSRNGVRKPEDRLLALFPAIVLLPLGIIIEGACLTHKSPPIGTGFGIAIASFGLQIATTVVYTYTAEVSHISALLTPSNVLAGRTHTYICYSAIDSKQPRSVPCSILVAKSLVSASVSTPSNLAPRWAFKTPGSPLPLSISLCRCPCSR